jgi:hypothetical protein
MVNTDVVFYDIPVPEDLPPHLDVGAIYFIRSTGALRINHGNEIVQYGGFSGPPGKPGPEGITWKGPWQANTKYFRRDTVEYYGNAWILKVEEVDNVAPPQTADELNDSWDLFARAGIVGPKGDPGPVGPRGAGLVWRSAWNGTVEYNPADVVRYKSNAWVCNIRHMNIAPPDTPTGTSSVWDLLVPAGQDGTGIGDMTKAVYDTDGDGVVDKAETAITATTADFATAADTADMASDTPWHAALQDQVDAGETASTKNAADIVAEATARKEADDALTEKIDAAIGKLRYLPSHNFGVALPTQEELTAYAKSHTGLGIVENATSVVNTFDNHEWVYNDGTQLWVDLGLNNVGTATNTTLGVVIGSTDPAKVSIASDGTQSVNGITAGVVAGITAVANPLTATNPVVDKKYMTDNAPKIATADKPGLVRSSDVLGYGAVNEDGLISINGLPTSAIQALAATPNSISENNPLVDKAYVDGALANFPIASGGGWDKWKVWYEQPGETIEWVSTIHGTVLMILIGGGGAGSSKDKGGSGGAGAVLRNLVPLRRGVTYRLMSGKGGASNALSGTGYNEGGGPSVFEQTTTNTIGAGGGGAGGGRLDDGFCGGGGGGGIYTGSWQAASSVGKGANAEDSATGGITHTSGVGGNGGPGGGNGGYGAGGMYTGDTYRGTGMPGVGCTGGKTMYASINPNPSLYAAGVVTGVCPGVVYEGVGDALLLVGRGGIKGFDGGRGMDGAVIIVYARSQEVE